MKNLFLKKIIQIIFSENFFCINIENADACAVVIKKTRKFEKTTIEYQRNRLKNVPRI